MFRTTLVALVLVAVTLAGIWMTTIGMMSLDSAQVLALPL
jgi:hypothetical protein